MQTCDSSWGVDFRFYINLPDYLSRPDTLKSAIIKRVFGRALLVKNTRMESRCIMFAVVWVSIGEPSCCCYFLPKTRVQLSCSVHPLFEQIIPTHRWPSQRHHSDSASVKH